MNETKKKAILMITALAIIATVTVTSGLPSQAQQLWEHVWKVEQPVDVTLDEPIDVTLDEPIEVDYPSDIELVHEAYYEDITLTRIHLDNISKYKYLYVYYAEHENPPFDDDMDCKIYYELDDGNFHFLAGTLTGQVGGESPLKIEVASPVIEIWLSYSGILPPFDEEVYVAVYGSTK